MQVQVFTELVGGLVAHLAEVGGAGGDVGESIEELSGVRWLEAEFVDDEAERVRAFACVVVVFKSYVQILNDYGETL